MSLRLSLSLFFFFNDTATTEIYTLSLHDALPIYQDVGVLDADRPRVVVGHIDAANAEADIVDDAAELIGRDDLVDRFADAVGELGRLFDPRAGLRPHMDLDLPAIDRREEVLAQIRREREREQTEAQEPCDELDAVVQAEL